MGIVNWQYALVYVNAIVTFLEDTEKHPQLLERTVNLLSNAEMKIKLINFHCFVKLCLRRPRHGLDKLQIVTWTTESIKAQQCPAIISKLQSSFGSRNVYQSFVLIFAKKASPLNQILNEEESLLFDPDEEKLWKF